MKEVYCSNCGDPIEQGFAINPEVSTECTACATEDMSAFNEAK